MYGVTPLHVHLIHSLDTGCLSQTTMQAFPGAEDLHSVPGQLGDVLRQKEVS